MAVYVLGKTKQQLMPCSEKRARLLLERERGAKATSSPASTAKPKEENPSTRTTTPR